MKYRLNTTGYPIRLFIFLIIVAAFSQACSKSKISCDTIFLEGDDIISLQPNNDADFIDLVNWNHHQSV